VKVSDLSVHDSIYVRLVFSRRAMTTTLAMCLCKSTAHHRALVIVQFPHGVQFRSLLFDQRRFFNPRVVRREQYFVPENSYGDAYHKGPKWYHRVLRPVRRFGYRYPRLAFFWLPLIGASLFLWGDFIWGLFVPDADAPQTHAEAVQRQRELFTYVSNFRVPFTDIKFNFNDPPTEHYLRERTKLQEEMQFKELTEGLE